MEMSVSAANFYISPIGSPNGDGTASRPWDLQTALDQPAAVQPGDTLWLRGGVHRQSNRPTRFRSALSGATNLPITVRQYPGERATIDGNITQAIGGWVNYWGFEIMNSYPNRLTMETGSSPGAFTVNYDGVSVDLTVSGFDLRAPHVKLINLIIHDCIGGGIGVGTGAVDHEIYGNLSFYNGWQGCDRGHGHGLYAQSSAPSLPRIIDNVFFANYGLGVQAYASSGHVDNFYLEGNAVFSNGALAREHQQNLLLGPYSGTAKDPVLIRNCIYDTQGSGADCNIGYTGGAIHPVVQDNYFQTSILFSPANQGLILSGNTFLNNALNLVQTDYPDNFYLTNRPETNMVIVRPNQYEFGRAQIIIYNWQNLTNVAVDMSEVLEVGMPFEVRNAQDYFGAAVLCGVYIGDPLELPMTGLRVAKPVGTNAPPSTAPVFDVFIVKLRFSECDQGGSGASTLSLSPISDQFTEENTPIAPIPFAIRGTETLPQYLTVSVHSSNPALVPNPNLDLGGNGVNRTVAIRPARDQVGETTLTLAVNDGFATATNIFVLTVRPASQGDSLWFPTAANQPSRNLGGSTAPSSLIVLPDRTVSGHISATAPGTFWVQASTDLFTWTDLTVVTLECEAGIVSFLDDQAPNYPTRFYRLEPESKSGPSLPVLGGPSALR